ncbi:putative metalloprotease CJM1_0395 family protein [Limisalsivibrio acetivorans]|uniref:putative metalloprotease CJM1_0395 family protein n=1 Tax=Limisalsivibrio acetivorans TaxID=1304888 RepID=UPI0003B55213|nr:putative metalloprotease CJM1_0395 family protein [Limisalsivibrio acetivorans]
MLLEAINASLTGRITPAGSTSSTARPKPVEPIQQPTRDTGQSIGDRVSISPEARSIQAAKKSENSEFSTYDKSGRSSAGANQELTQEEQQKVDELKKRDQEVRTHEMQHKTAGAPYTSGPTYEYENGPDGKRYAVGGSVDIDTSEIEGDPQATIEKAQKIKAAATAPAEPSSEDRAVAAEASAMEMRAKQDLQKEQTENTEENSKTGQTKSGFAQYAKAAYAGTMAASLNISA